MVWWGAAGLLRLSFQGCTIAALKIHAFPLVSINSYIDLEDFLFQLSTNFLCPVRNFVICFDKNSLMVPLQVNLHIIQNVYLNTAKYLEYTEWKGNKCQTFNSRRGRLKGPKNVYTIWSLNFIVSSEKDVSCSVLFTSYCLHRWDNAKKFISVGLSYKGLILFWKIF